MTEFFYKPGESVALATKHGKERAVSRPFSRKLGLRVVVPDEIDTDAFGTFTGEIERDGSALETAFAKARLGMKLTGLALGLASEGSFGAHPSLPFAVAGCELLVFVDDRHGFQLAQQIVTAHTNFAYAEISSFDELEKFLSCVKFPSHALIAYPNRGRAPDAIFKGLQSIEALEKAVNFCRDISEDKRVLVETDMRAHLNPTRMRVIRRLAVKLARRLATLCPKCSTPGFGLVDLERSLKCALCGLATLLARAEIHACAKCDYRENRLI